MIQPHSAPELFLPAEYAALFPADAMELALSQEGLCYLGVLPHANPDWVNTAA